MDVDYINVFFHKTNVKAFFMLPFKITANIFALSVGYFKVFSYIIYLFIHYNNTPTKQNVE